MNLSFQENKTVCNSAAWFTSYNSSCDMGEFLRFFLSHPVAHLANLIGVATIVQGDRSPRDFCPMPQLSKQTFVQGDFCSKKRFPVKSLLKLIFFKLRLTKQVCYILKNDNMSSFHFAKLTPQTKGNLDICLLGQLCHWTKVPWTNFMLDNCPLDNCCNTGKLICPY